MSKTASALDGLRVLELSALAGAVCGRVLADLGAEVIKLEPAGGEPFRRSLPVVPTALGDESAAWLAYNHGKKSVTLDPVADEAAFAALCAGADIVVTDWERLDLDTMDQLAAIARAANPALVWCEILPFGRGGPFERYAATDTVLQALGGHLYLNGDVDRPPVRISLPVGSIQGGAEAASAALMAYWHALKTGEGQRVDVSVQACIVWTLLNSTMAWQILGLNEMRGGAIRKERANRFYTRLVWDTQDGYIFFGPVGGGGGSARIKSYEALVSWMAEEGITDPILTRHDWNGDGQFFIPQEDYDAVTQVILGFVRTKTTDELITRAVKERILLAPISSVAGVFDNPQYRARGYFRPLADPVRQLDIELPARWANLSATPLRAPMPAPLPGADTAAVLSTLEQGTSA
ncbi:CoA transferase [Pararhodobacter zhoushanensis]|uniref:CoA transferase n=1 Tax=Pararhodobacter zhoushanensis TaxID=2479545 RepID=A0ABT3H5K6_9RHOB|nr:CoA transferase [Pararhodobacter zhoushanensis]MCW1935008.1 CoA transferase [Pararhodobacter zhoushanensis]